MFRRHIQIPLWIIAVAAVVIFGFGAIAGTAHRHNVSHDLTLLQFALPSGTNSYEAEMTGMTVELADMVGARDAKGVFVSSVRCGGLQSGDVIVEINGNPVVTTGDLQIPLGITTPGAVANVTVIRNGVQNNVTLARAATPAAVTISPVPVSSGSTEQFGGISIADLSPVLAEQVGLPPGARGIVVTDVDPYSPAGVAGLLPGDVIRGVNNTPVQTVTELQDALWRMALTPVVLYVSRGGTIYSFTVPTR